MSIADAAGIASPHPNAVAKSWRVAIRLESALWVYKGQHPDPRPLIATMTREFGSLTKRFDEGYLKSKKTAAECRMANMLVEDVLSHGAYELPEPARRHIIAYSDIATPPWTTEPPGAQHARWYMRRKISRGGSSAYHMRGMQRYLMSRALSPARPPCAGSGAAGVGGVVDQKIRDTDYAKTISHQWCDAHGQGQAPLDLTEPRLEAELTNADNMMAAETRSTGYYILL
jgi:hypothetical protein